MKNPLELLISRRDEIVEMYKAVHSTKAYDIKTVRNIKSRQDDLDGLKKMMDEYESTIKILNEINMKF